MIKKAALALVYKPQGKCFQSSCLGLKNIKFSKTSANFFLKLISVENRCNVVKIGQNFSHY